MLREEVTETDVADIVSKWSGIPVRRALLCKPAPWSQSCLPASAAQSRSPALGRYFMHMDVMCHAAASVLAPCRRCDGFGCG